MEQEFWSISQPWFMNVTLPVHLPQDILHVSRSDVKVAMTNAAVFHLNEPRNNDELL